MRILPETPADIDAIFALTQTAFADHPHSEQTEGYINDALRRAGALTLSLVAHEDGRQVGHAAFSPVTIGDGSADWYGLGRWPCCPACRAGRGRGADSRGPGAAAGAGRGGLRGDGDPAYYRRFGFETRPDLRYPGVPPEYFMALVYTRPASGDVAYHEAFARARRNRAARRGAASRAAGRPDASRAGFSGSRSSAWRRAHAARAPARSAA